MYNEVISVKAREALKHIRNWVAHHGKMPSVRELMNAMNYKSSRSALLLMNELCDNGFLDKKDGSLRMIRDLNPDYSVKTISIPLVGSIACGIPLLAEENIEAMIKVSTSLAQPGEKYFFLKATGNSMDQAGIQHGDLILVRQQYIARNKDIVVALIDDEATVKEFLTDGRIVMLVPRSSDERHQPIIATSEIRIQGIVETAIPIGQIVKM